MVKALHDAGIEVILDVVYNHTAEGNELGPTLSLPRHRQRLLLPARSGRPRATTSTSPAAATRSTCIGPRVLQLVMDSLRYWVEEMHVDGFRFDLATTLARGQDSGFDAQRELPRRDRPGSGAGARQADRRAVGHRRRTAISSAIFRRGWSEWNDRYRDAVRRFWKGEDGTIGETGVARDRLQRHLRSPRPAPAAPASTSSPPTTVSPSLTSSATTPSTTTPTTKATATAPTRTTAGTAARKAQPTMR